MKEKVLCRRCKIWASTKQLKGVPSCSNCDAPRKGDEKKL